MPTGSWFSSLTGPTRSITGTGAPSQPKGFGGLADSPNAPLGGYNAFAPAAPGNPGTTSSTPRPVRQQVDAGALGNQTLPHYVPTALRDAAASTSIPSYNPLGGVRSLVDTMYGPQTSILADTLARQQAQLGMVGTDTAYRSDALRRDTDLSRQLLGLDKQGIGLNREALGVDANQTRGQLSNLGKLRGILKSRYGLEDEQLANQLAQLGIDETKLRDMSRRELFDMRSTLTARGAFNTVANERGTGRVNRDLMYGLGTIGNQRTAADIGYRSRRLGLDEQGIGYDNQELGLRSRLSNIGIDSRRLDLDMQRLGINDQQLTNSLEDGLYQIGLQGQVSLNNLLDAIGGTNQQQATLARTILDQMLQFSNLPPEVIRDLEDALGIKTPAQQQVAPTSPGAQL